MGTSINTNVTSTQQKLINEKVNKFTSTIQEDFSLEIDNEANLTNSGTFEIIDSSVDGLNVNQNNNLKVLQAAINTTQAAVEQGASAEQIDKIANDIKKDQEQTSQLGTSINTDITNTDIEVVNKILNEYQTTIKKSCQNKFKDKKILLNEIKVIAKNSDVKNFNVNQNNASDTDGSSKTESKTEDKKQAVSKGETVAENKTDTKTKQFSGLSTGAIIGIVIAVVVVGGIALFVYVKSQKKKTEMVTGKSGVLNNIISGGAKNKNPYPNPYENENPYENSDSQGDINGIANGIANEIDIAYPFNFNQKIVIILLSIMVVCLIIITVEQIIKISLNQNPQLFKQMIKTK